MISRQELRKLWEPIDKYWQDADAGWVSYEFPNRRRLLMEGEPSGQTTVTYDGAFGETTVSVDRADLVQFVADVMAMPEVDR